jgi:1-acyl-sn-glycerol-3-phosphate acyltransferase
VTERQADSEYTYSRALRLVSIIILRPLLRLLLKRDWAGQQNIPRSGGLILAPNHISYADVFAMALYSYESGRYPVFLAKDTIFKIKVIGTIVRKLGQLPVHRGQVDAALVLRDAERGIAQGACVIVYPEATCTRDPDLWPMTAKTGVARLALGTGAPVIPIAHWGAQNVLPYGSRRPRLFPRRVIHMTAGPPVDLSEFRDKPLSAPTLRAATSAVMHDITDLLADLRGEQPPAVPYNPRGDRRAQRTVTGTDAGASQPLSGPAGTGSGRAGQG